MPIATSWLTDSQGYVNFGIKSIIFCSSDELICTTSFLICQGKNFGKKASQHIACRDWGIADEVLSVQEK